MVRWYYTFNRGETSLIKEQNITKTSIPVCNEGNGYKQFAVFRTPLNLYDFCINEPDEKRCLFELIHGNRYQKFYVDIDISLDDEYKEIMHTRDQKISIAHQLPEMIIDGIIKTTPDR